MEDAYANIGEDVVEGGVTYQQVTLRTCNTVMEGDYSLVDLEHLSRYDSKLKSYIPKYLSTKTPTFVFKFTAVNQTATIKFTTYSGTKIYWGDGAVTNASSTSTHTYSEAGVYEVRVIPGSTMCVFDSYVFGQSTSSFNDYCIAADLSDISSDMPEYFLACCAALKKVIFNDAITTFTNAGICLQCGELEYVKLPKRLQSLASTSFYSCYRLASMKLPHTLSTIGASCFYGCSSLTEITIPNNVTTIGNNAFSGCQNIVLLRFNAKQCNSLSSSTSTHPFYNTGSSGYFKVMIGANVTSLPSYFMYGNSYLKEVSGGHSLTTINTYAFRECTNLVKVDSFESLTTIGTYAFYQCSSLTEIIISEKVTSIGDYAFYGCSSVNTINFNASSCANKSSSNYVFYNVGSSSASVVLNIGPTVSKIPAYMFFPYSSSSYSPQIRKVNWAVDNKCTSIGNYAFAYCNLIKEMALPEGVTTIGSGAFSSMSALVYAYIPTSVTTITASSTTTSSLPFGSCSSSLILYCGAESKQSNWGTYWNCYSGSSGKLRVLWKSAYNIPDIMYALNTKRAKYVGRCNSTGSSKYIFYFDSNYSDENVCAENYNAPNGIPTTLKSGDDLYIRMSMSLNTSISSVSISLKGGTTITASIQQFSITINADKSYSVSSGSGALPSGFWTSGDFLHFKYYQYSTSSTPMLYLVGVSKSLINGLDQIIEKDLATIPAVVLDNFPLDSAVVHNTGNETVAGTKTFTGTIYVPDVTIS